ncbi:M16 family metallopeptidase [Horticoccus sp. 23ND18S-11]|uniref:M16 family metallopeptidase n=1 Tax=Horticoccus sp. 23ND18S-11 TaxID=3391832 RepID=UPI0039C9297A
MPKSYSASGDLGLLDAFWREPVERVVLPNGLTLIMKRDTSAALASVQVWVKTGSVHEGEHLGAGLSHYVEHMLFKGTERRAGREISATVQAHGGYINAYTTFDRTVYYIDLPSEHTGVALDLLADAVLHSTLPADEAAKEKDVILREIAMTKDDPDNRLWDAVFAAAFREHPYRQPIIGHRDIFSTVTREDLNGYYRARYVPNNLVVVVVGDIDLTATRALVEQHFGSAPRVRLAPVLVPAEPPQLAPRTEQRFEDIELTRAVMAWPIPGLAHADAPVLDLLAMVLGHGDSSVLWQEVREKAGLVHTIDASAWNPGSTGLFCISFSCDADKRVAAEAAIRRTLLACAQRGFTAAQLRKAMRQLVVGEINSRKTMSGQASRLGVAEVVVGDLDHSRTFFAHLQAVTPVEVRQALTTYLAAERLTAVSLNPTAAAIAPVASASTSSSQSDFSEVRLPNGVRLLLQPDHRLPNVHLRFLMQGGALFEDAAKRGATALLATMLTKDTRRRTAAAVAQYIEEIGGSFYPFSGNNSLGLGAEVLPPDIDRAIALMADAVLAPTFKAATFKLERDAQVASLQQDDDDVVTLARKRLREKFFGAHPLALDPHGDQAGVKALTPADLAALHRRLCVGSNVVLAVAGDFDPRKLTAKLKRFLARIPKAKTAAARWETDSPSALPATAGDFVETQPREQAVVLQGFPGPRVNSSDFYASEVIDELFSGMASRLFERVREEKGLAYFVRSGRVTGLDAGMFYFVAGTQPGREGEVLAEIDAEIARVQAGAVEPAELTRCQTRLKAARRQSLQTNSSRAMQAGLNALQGQPVNDWKNYDAHIDAVTLAEVTEFARRRLARALRTQLVVRP